MAVSSALLALTQLRAPFVAQPASVALKAAYIAKLAAGTVIKTEPTPVAVKTAKVRS